MSERTDTIDELLMLKRMVKAGSKEDKALDYAISSLKTDEIYNLMYEHPEFVADCISKKKVCDYIAEFVNHEFATDDEVKMVKGMIEGIKHMSGDLPDITKTGWNRLKCIIKHYKGETDVNDECDNALNPETEG